SYRHTVPPLCAFGRSVSVPAPGKAGRRGADIDAPARRKGRDAMTKLGSVAISLLTVAAALVLAKPAAAQDDAGAQLGKVHFETSCNAAAQQRFDRAMRYQHSFWYRASCQ